MKHKAKGEASGLQDAKRKFYARRGEFVKAVQRDKSLSGDTKVVAAVLMDHLSFEGEGIFPSVTTIAKDAGTTERTVYRAIAALRASGWFVVSPRIGKGKRAHKNTSNEYFPIWERAKARQEEPELATNPLMDFLDRPHAEASESLSYAFEAGAVHLTQEEHDALEAELGEEFPAFLGMVTKGSERWSATDWRKRFDALKVEFVMPF